MTDKERKLYVEKKKEKVNAIMKRINDASNRFDKTYNEIISAR
jgi:hypothetical protein|tara:strand:+ start:125 stop:253 length:129 start_codon:yes stop_codon:yes gene_type:complete